MPRWAERGRRAARMALLAVAALAGACAPAPPLTVQVAAPVTPAATAGDARRSGYHFMSRATQALQDDDSQNPAFLWVQDGRQRFEAQCTRCHHAQGLQDAAARYPAFDTTTQRPISLSGRIRQCHSLRMGVPAPAADSDALLALESYLAHAARGRPIVGPQDARLAPFVEQGRQWWFRRLGQIDLSCADCHDGLPGRRLAGSTIPQGHPTGYPLYRLEWQSLGSLQRRLRGCLTGVRAEPFADGAEEWVLLELYLKQRAAGMASDAPAVRP